MNIIIVGLSHKTAPVEIREKLSFPPQTIDEPLKKLCNTYGINEGVIVSTCNRVEVFAVTPDIEKGLWQVKRFLSEYHNMRLDRMTMAHGVEARVPFLDHRVVEYALQIPLPTLFGKSGKGWLQNIAKPWVPAEILNRPKVHFPSLPDQWLSGMGAKWTAEILLDHKAYIREWIKPKVLERYIMEHKEKIRNRGRLLWALIVLELWLQNLYSWRDVKRTH